MKVPFVQFDAMHAPLKQEMMLAFEHFFDSNRFILGEKVKTFEEEYARFSHTHYALGVSNGLDALQLALRTLGVKQGDEVIIPSNTFIATALAVSYVGATPVFVEPDLKTYNIKAESIEKAITEKTKAIIPVHLYGQCCEMDEILQLAYAHHLYVIEDNAQAQGSTYKGRYSGSFGAINATSFYPGKNLGALGDAGGLTTNSQEYYERAKALQNYGSHVKYVHDELGYNMRMDECQAAFLSIKLKQLERWNHQRQQIAERYNELLKGVEDLILPSVANGATHVYHLFVIRSRRRDALQKHLAENGVGTLIHYPIPPHLQKAYAHFNFSKGNFPIAEEIAETCLSLPIWPGMTEEMISYVCDCLKNMK